MVSYGNALMLIIVVSVHSVLEIRMDLGKKSILRPKTTTKRLYPIGLILARIKIPYIWSYFTK